MRNITLVISMMIITFSLFFIGSETVNASDWKTTNKKYGYDQPLKNLTGCTFKGDVTDEALEIRGIAKKKNGRTINKKLFKDSCFLVYGSPSDVKDNKTKDSYGNQKYLGYDQFGKKAVNPKYNTHGDVFQGNLVLRNTFFKIGSGKNQVNKNFIAERRLYKGIPVPTTNKQGSAMKKAGKSVEDVLDTAYDTTRIIYRWQNTSKMPSRNQLRGNFTKERNSTDPFGNKSSPGGVLTGKRLTSYANITQVPSDYSPGTFQMYHKCAPNNKTFRLCYSGYTIPPIKEFGKEKESVVLNKFSVSPKELWEKEKITTNFTIKNDGEIGVKDPNMKVTLSCDGFTSKTKHKKFKGIFKPGKTKKGELTFNAPQLTGNTKSDDVECKVSIDRGNDIKKSSYSVKSGVSTSHKLKVKRVKRDLYVKDLEVLGDDYFEKDNGGLYDNKERIFEGDVVHFRYKLGYRSNKKNESVTNPVVDLGNEGLDGIEGKHKPKITLKAGTKKTDKENGMDYYNESDWIYPDFKDDKYKDYKKDTQDKFKNKTSSVDDGVLSKVKGLFKTKVVHAAGTNPESDFEFENGEITKYIGDRKDVVIPETINGVNVSVIGYGSFEKKEIESVVIPDTVELVRSQSFVGNKIKELHLGKNVKFDSFTFLGLTFTLFNGDNNGQELETITVHEDNPHLIFENGILYSKDKKTVWAATKNWESSGLIGVEEIKDYAFINTGKKGNLKIPKTITNIGWGVFQNNNITSIDLPDTLAKIESGAFRDNEITSVEIPESVTSLGDSSFRSNRITSVNLPYLKIGKSSFENQSIDLKGKKLDPNKSLGEYITLELVLYGQNMPIGPLSSKIGDISINQEIEIYAMFGDLEYNLKIENFDIEKTCFETKNVSGGVAITKYNKESCEMGSDVEIPSEIDGKKVVSIGDESFIGKDITSVKIPNTVREIGESAFHNNHITKLELSDNITRIKENAFRYNKIKDIKIPGGLDKIEDSVFSNNEITDLTIPGNIKLIHGFAFNNNRIEDLKFKEGVEYIGQSAFAVNAIKDVEIPRSMRSINTNAFLLNNISEVEINSQDQETFIIGISSFAENPLTKVFIKGGKDVYITSDAFNRGFLTGRFSENPLLFDVSKDTNITLITDIYSGDLPTSYTVFGDSGVENKNIFLYGNSKDLENESVKLGYRYNSHMNEVADTNLESCLYNEIPKNNGKLRSYDFLIDSSKNLDCSSKNISDLDGFLEEKSLGKVTKFNGNVKNVDLSDNSITDVSKLLGYGGEVEFDVTKQKNESSNDKFNISHYNKDNLVVGVPTVVDSSEDLDLSSSSFGTVENGLVDWSPAFEMYTPIIKHSYNSNGINFSGEVFYDTAEVDPDMPELGEDNTDFEDDYENDVCDLEENSDDETCATVDGDDFDEGESIDTDDSIESLDNIPTAGMIKNNLNASGIVTEREHFKEYEEKVFTEVNQNAKKPKYEEDRKEDNKAKLSWYNNKKELPYNTVHRVYDLGIKIKDIRPKYPKSNETIEVDIQVCNHGNMDVGKYSYELKLGDPNRQSNTDVVFKKERNGIKRGAYNNIDVVDNCKLFTEEIKVMDVEKMTEDMKLIGEIEIDNIPNGYKDVDPSNNKDDKDVTVRNPNASISLKNETGESGVISETGGVSLVVRNNMFKDISDSCQGDECKLNTENRNTYATVTNLETNKSENVVIDYNNLGHGKAKSYDLSNVVERLIGDGGPDNYRAIEFEIKAGIPHYKNEVDYSGDAKYGDNDLVEKVKYYPERLMLQACNEIDSNGYFKFIGGNGTESSDGDLIKSCAGHYPNFPSTSIEKGMESYHYFMYRFLPAPLPKYIIENSGVDDKTNPEYFNQTFKVESDINEEPGEDYIITKREGDRAMERARYIPTGAVFNYKITEKKEDGGKLIATGKVNYNLDNQECNMRDNLDVKHQYGCDEVMLFLPNVDGNKFKKPAPSDGNFNYPVENTRVPYLNPGLYEFSVDVDERYELVKQYNKGEREEYYWKNTND